MPEIVEENQSVEQDFTKEGGALADLAEHSDFDEETDD